MTRRHAARPPVAVTRLEGRVVPAVVAQSFEQMSTGQLPAGWASWVSNGRGHVTVESGPGLGGSNAVVTRGASDSVTRAWVAETTSADVRASASLYLGSLVPVQVIVRGQNLDTDAPTYYGVSAIRGTELELVRVENGVRTTLGTVTSARWFSGEWVRLTIDATGDSVAARLFRSDTGEYLDASGQWVVGETDAIRVRDTAIGGDGQTGVNRVAIYSGDVAIDDFTVESVGMPEAPAETPVEAPAAEEPPPAAPSDTGMTPVPRHFGHIRVAQLAYHGTPFGEVEQQLLRDGVDLVVPHPNYLSDVNAVSPDTPQFIYLNTSNIYENLLTDWNGYADARGGSREDAFYHVNRATPFTGDSASSLAVNKFWAVYQNKGSQLLDRTTAARGVTHAVEFPDRDGSVYLGYPEKFREINFEFAHGAANGWTGVVEYATAVDGRGVPVAWRAVKTVSDTTAGLRGNGTITFDPAADWVTASVNGSARLHYVRVRTLTPGEGPVARTISGRDYVNAGGTISGTIPSFDFAADRDGDGYLSDAEFAGRRPGHDARFAYESRAFYPAYGQMRFATNPSNAAYRDWAADFTKRFLDANPLADGVFMDNSIGRLAFDETGIHESLANYSADYGTMLGQIDAVIAPRFVLANTAGARNSADGISASQVSYVEEFGLRPLASNHVQFQDLAGLIAHRRELSGGQAYEILDSYSVNGSPDDPRTQIATLAMYYLLADPDISFLLMNGGAEPNSGWDRHWTEAIRFDVGQPKGDWGYFATGQDPENGSLDYYVFSREYDNAVVLYKPRSYNQGTNGNLGDGTATTHDLNGTYRPLNADGSLGPVVTRVTLRNGEGAILVRV